MNGGYFSSDLGQGDVLVDVTNMNQTAEGKAFAPPYISEEVDYFADYKDDVPVDTTWKSSKLFELEAEYEWTCQDHCDGMSYSKLDEEMIEEEAYDSDPQCVSEYAADIYGKLGSDEHRAPHPSYMKGQPDLDASARATAVDWLIGVQMKYNLKTETLFLSVSILDRFLATRRVQRKDLQLVACTSAFIAAKFEEIDPPEVRDFVYITDQSCRKEAILAMEVRMLTALEFCLCRPTAAHYLQRYQLKTSTARVDASQVEVAASPSQTHTALLQYLLELTLLDLRMMRFSPSLQAAAASLVSCRILKLARTTALEALTERMESALQHCAQEMSALLREAQHGSGEVWRKFSSPEFHSVATNAGVADLRGCVRVAI